MSRLLPEHLRVGLAPAAVTLGGRASACDPAFGPEPWQGAVDRLKNLEFDRRCRVTIVLSNHFVRYALVPPSEALAGEAEEDAYVRHHFARVHGERAKAWALRWSEGLASAVDSRLVAELKALFSKSRARLVSVQPHLMAAFNPARRSIPASGAWLVLAEPGRNCVALHAGGRWRSVQLGREDWPALLERERHRAAGAAPDLVRELPGGLAH